MVMAAVGCKVALVGPQLDLDRRMVDPEVMRQFFTKLVQHGIAGMPAWHLKMRG